MANYKICNSCIHYKTITRKRNFFPDLRADLGGYSYYYPKSHDRTAYGQPACELNRNPSIVNRCERCNSYKSRNIKQRRQKK